ncbi:MAG: hypothetical protein MUF54_02640 [Polyangiaceae bacterium]|nr:hypothetical protein [Polyangiaceae bacterium]
MQGTARDKLERVLPRFLAEQRWFAARGGAQFRARIADAVRIAAEPGPLYLTLVDVEDDRGSARYFLPLALSKGDEAVRVRQEWGSACIARVHDAHEPVILHDATVVPAFWNALLSRWGQEWQGRSLKGRYTARPLEGCVVDGSARVRLLGAEQSNTSAIVGDVYAKLYRRVESGPNPEVELLSYLSGVGFQSVPKLVGTLTYRWSGHEQALGILQRALAIDSNAWEYALVEYGKFIERVLETRVPESPRGSDPNNHPGWLEGVGKEILQMARALGVRVAELHIALAAATDPDLVPVALRSHDLERLADVLRSEIDETRRRVETAAVQVSDDVWSRADQLLRDLAQLPAQGLLLRVHGDLHLGQIAHTQRNFILLDFEGEPDRSVPERRERDQAVRDVAGMIRSLEYAGLVALAEASEREPGKTAGHEAWVRTMIRWTKAVFLDAYRHTSSGQPYLPPVDQQGVLLKAYLLHKVLYEIRYELGHRPGWVWMPISGLERLLAQDGSD